jgi:hypothetical protein
MLAGAKHEPKTPDCARGTRLMGHLPVSRKTCAKRTVRGGVMTFGVGPLQIDAVAGDPGQGGGPVVGHDGGHGGVDAAG